VRRLVALFVPLRKPQWNRTEEITSAVVGTVVPFAIALFLVEYVQWFGQHPFQFQILRVEMVRLQNGFLGKLQRKNLRALAGDRE